LARNSKKTQLVYSAPSGHRFLNPRANEGAQIKEHPYLFINREQSLQKRVSKGTSCK